MNSLPATITPDAEGFLTGICQMPDAEYFAAEGFTQTGAKKILRSPAHFRYGVEKDTEALNFGDQFDRYLCDRENFQSKLAVKPRGMKFSTTAGKDWQAAQEAAGKEIIAEADYDNICGMSDALWSHPHAKEILEASDLQVCAFAPFALGGKVQRKGKFDVRPRLAGANFIADIKTTEDARESQFIRQIWSYGYHIQAASYLDLNNAATNEQRTVFLFIVVEKEKPWGVSIYNIPAASDNPRIPTITEGRRAYTQAIQTYMECKASGVWPCYSQNILTLGSDENRRAA